MEEFNPQRLVLRQTIHNAALGCESWTEYGDPETFAAGIKNVHLVRDAVFDHMLADTPENLAANIQDAVDRATAYAEADI